jgi:hypothetical protein
VPASNHPAPSLTPFSPPKEVSSLTGSATRLGLTDRPWTWSRLLAQRLFPSRTPLPDAWQRIYHRDWDDDAHGPFVRHRLVHAA